MFSSLPGKLLAAIAGLAMLGGGVLLWSRADGGRAEATRAPLRAAVLPPAGEEDAMPDPVEAPRPKSREEKRFARVDRDDDGRITQAEYLALRRRNFDKLDLNGDGRLSFEEYAIKGIEKFREVDKDRNGQLSAAEFALTAPKPSSRQMASVGKCACNPVRSASADREELQD
jgi:hypothetical protein